MNWLFGSQFTYILCLFYLWTYFPTKHCTNMILYLLTLLTPPRWWLGTPAGLLSYSHPQKNRSGFSSLVSHSTHCLHSNITPDNMSSCCVWFTKTHEEEHFIEGIEWLYQIHAASKLCLVELLFSWRVSCSQNAMLVPDRMAGQMLGLRGLDFPPLVYSYMGEQCAKLL